MAEKNLIMKLLKSIYYINLSTVYFCILYLVDNSLPISLIITQYEKRDVTLNFSIQNSYSDNIDTVAFSIIIFAVVLLLYLLSYILLWYNNVVVFLHCLSYRYWCHKS